MWSGASCQNVTYLETRPSRSQGERSQGKQRYRHLELQLVALRMARRQTLAICGTLRCYPQNITIDAFNLVTKEIKCLH